MMSGQLLAGQAEWRAQPPRSSTAAGKPQCLGYFADEEAAARAYDAAARSSLSAKTVVNFPWSQCEHEEACVTLMSVNKDEADCL